MYPRFIEFTAWCILFYTLVSAEKKKKVISHSYKVNNMHLTKLQEVRTMFLCLQLIVKLGGIYTNSETVQCVFIFV